MKTAVTWIVVILVVLGGWYWWSKSQSSTSESTTTEQAGLNGSDNQTNTGQANVPPVVIVKTDPKLGEYIAATNGMTLYRYTKDGEQVSNCTGACLAVWPAYTPPANEPLVAGEAAVGMLEPFTRADGQTQLMYNDYPLYYYAKDTKPGDVMGQGVGGVWFVVKP